jgi:hypothetical protein
MKTTIRLSFILLLISCTSSLSAQKLSGGFEAAVSTSSVKITDVHSAGLNTIKGKGIMGYEGGVLMRINVLVLYVKPKALFHYEEGELDYTVNLVEQSTTFSAGKILIPVLIGYKFLPPVLSLEAGPVFNYLVFATKNFEGNTVDLQKSGLGYRVGLNAQLSIINLTISYQGIKNKGSSTNISSYSAPDALVFGVGLIF